MNSSPSGNRILALALIVSLSAACAGAEPAGSLDAVPEIAGRTAGAPRDCVPINASTSLRIVDERTVLYGSGETVWLNHFRTACPGADRMEVLVTEPMGTQYCSGERVRVLDPQTRAPGAVCVLGDFVPYTF